MSAKFPSTYYLSVLIYPNDEGEYIAHCLEMDLIGIGDTHKKAVEDLADHIEMQVSFARQEECPEMLWHPAPKRLLNKFEELARERVTGMTRKRKYDIAQVPYPKTTPALAFCNA